MRLGEFLIPSRGGHWAGGGKIRLGEFLIPSKGGKIRLKNFLFPGEAVTGLEAERSVSRISYSHKFVLELETAQMRPGLLESNGLLLPQRLD